LTPANRASPLLQFHGRGGWRRGIYEVSSIKVLIPPERVRRAVNGVRARLDANVYNRPGSAAELRRRIALDIDLLDGIDGKNRGGVAGSEAADFILFNRPFPTLAIPLATITNPDEAIAAIKARLAQSGRGGAK